MNCLAASLRDRTSTGLASRAGPSYSSHTHDRTVKLLYKRFTFALRLGRSDCSHHGILLAPCLLHRYHYPSSFVPVDGERISWQWHVEKGVGESNLVVMIICVHHFKRNLRDFLPRSLMWRTRTEGWITQCLVTYMSTCACSVCIQCKPDTGARE